MLRFFAKFLQGIGQHPVRAGLVLALLALAGYLAYPHLGGWHHYRQALEALQERDFSRARGHLAHCLRAWPGSASTYFLAARTARRDQHLDEAKFHLEACHRLGGSAEGVILEKYLLRAQGGEAHEVENKLRAFVQKEHPDILLILEVLTGQWINDHRLQEALAYLELWLKHQPADREALARHGHVLERLLDIRGAIDSYKKALELDPEEDRHQGDRLRLRLAELLVQKNRSQEALAHLEVLKERQAANPQIPLGLARCLHLQGESEKALKLLEELQARHPQDWQVLRERGRILLSKGQADKAAALFRQAVALRPFDREVLFHFSGCLKKIGQSKEAEVLEKRLDRIRGDENRMREVMQALLKSPQDPWLRSQAGIVFLRNGFTEDGQRWLLSALKYDPQHELSHQALAEFFESQGRKDRALPHRRALEKIGKQPAADRKK